MNTTFESVVYRIIESGIRPLMILAFAVATILFLRAVLMYLAKPKDIKGTDVSKTIMWGVVILAAMFSIWGLVNLVVNFFNLPNSEAIDIPRV